MKILYFRSSEKILNSRVLSNNLLELGGPLVQVSESSFYLHLIHILLSNKKLVITVFYIE